MRPERLNALFAPITSLSGVGPKQDKLFRYLLDRAETPRVVDLLFHLPSAVIDRSARPTIRDAVAGTVATLHVTIDRHRPPPPGRSRAPYIIYASDETGDLILTWFRGDRAYLENSCLSARSATSPVRCKCMTAPADGASRPHRR